MFRVPRSGSAPVSRFAELYAAGDPWRADSLYERRKRAVVLASLPRERYRRAFEPGCGAGELTRDQAIQQIEQGWEKITDEEGRDDQKAAYTDSLNIQR